MKCLVIGGAGSLGVRLVNKLIDKDFEVIVWDDFSTGKKENINPKAHYYYIDAANFCAKDYTNSRFEIIYNCLFKDKVKENISELSNLLGLKASTFSKAECENLLD